MRSFRGAVTFLAFALVACGGGGATAPANNNNPGGTNPGGTNPGPSTSKDINVLDGSFDPAATTVAAGSTVTWSWKTNITHNVTFTSGNLTGSGDKNAGSFAKAFPAAGTFGYHCTIHTGMEGTVTVQ